MFTFYKNARYPPTVKPDILRIARPNVKHTPLVIGDFIVKSRKT